jgi:hypothetical protein
MCWREINNASVMGGRTPSGRFAIRDSGGLRIKSAEKKRRSRPSGSDRPFIQRGNQMAMVFRNGKIKFKSFGKKAINFYKGGNSTNFLPGAKGLNPQK